MSNCKDIYKLYDMVFLVLLNAFLSEDLLRRKSLECLVNLKGQNCKKGTTETFNYIFRWDFFLIWARLKLFVRKHIKREGTKSETNQTFKMGWNNFWSSIFIPIMFSWYLFSYDQDICFCLKHSVVACRLHQLAQQSHWPRNSARLLETQPHALDFSNAPSKIISTRFWLLGFVGQENEIRFCCPHKTLCAF